MNLAVFSDARAYGSSFNRSSSKPIEKFLHAIAEARHDGATALDSTAPLRKAPMGLRADQTFLTASISKRPQSRAALPRRFGAWAVTAATISLDLGATWHREPHVRRRELANLR